MAATKTAEDRKFTDNAHASISEKYIYPLVGWSVRVREDSVRFIYGNHEQNSEFMVRNFIPLSVAESTAILHHHAGMSWDSAKEDCASVFNRYSIASALHTADFMSTFITERK